MDRRTEQPKAPPDEAATVAERAPREPRQRWRLTFRRLPEAPAIPHREIADAWMMRLAEAGLPLPRTEGSRQRPALTFAAPLPLGMPVEADLADLYLADRCRAWDVRDRLAAASPGGIEVLELHDVWLGSPALSAIAAAADYRIELGGYAPEGLKVAAAELIAAPSVIRRRQKGNGTVDYDLRPLLESIDLVADRGAPLLRVRTRINPERGAGRPEEVLAALADVLGRPVQATSTVRERILTTDDIEASSQRSPD
ncbi:MAG TPA: TIGR03936 family radical SAM-associated protein [Candidatus Limnocylindrales bacterium]|nr:TIGR03936 family radical SAM-associated protein [Candidatus Limnocylindrales bacterium]